MLTDDDVAAELIRRARLDQTVRRKPDKTPEDYERWRAVDADNRGWLRRLVNSRGWPGISQVGPAGCAAAWLLAQHADREPRLQVDCLRLMRDALSGGEVELWQVAYLTDRVFSNAGRPQLFGTQYASAGDGPPRRLPVVARPLADPAAFAAASAVIELFNDPPVAAGGAGVGSSEETDE